MVDVAGLIAAPTTDDFILRVGNNNDPQSWTLAPAPKSITVRHGAGIDGSDRITLAWADGVIQKTWLEVTVRPGGVTGLAENDVFYFGNAVGDSGDLVVATFVDGTDFVRARDNPRNFLNRAPIDFPYDYNRDSFVDGFDLAVTRDNGTNFVTALQLIAPPLAFASALPQARPTLAQLVAWIPADDDLDTVNRSVSRMRRLVDDVAPTIERGFDVGVFKVRPRGMEQLEGGSSRASSKNESWSSRLDEDELLLEILAQARLQRAGSLNALSLW
jgi:hypothetical protein